MKLVYLPEARQDVLAAVSYYYECDGGENSLAADFYQELQNAERDIIEMPELWSSISKGFRRRLMKRFPFDVIYHQVDENTIEIVAVAHQKRKPNYWKHR